VVGVVIIAIVIVLGVVGVATKGSSHEKGRVEGAAEPTTVTGVPVGWNLALNAEFPGTTLDTKVWATCYWWSSKGCTNNPKVEKEWYLPSQVQVSGGVLNLVAQSESTQGVSAKGAPDEYNCRSGMVTSEPGFNFTYGLVQVVAKIPYGAGLWPALWLGASNHQWPPELDILEHWHSESLAKVYDHPFGAPAFGGPVPTPGDLSDGWHTYSLLWTKDSVTWYIDGAQVYATTTYIPHQAMYFIADLADDSTAVDACTGTLEIQSVKVWQP
jgi:beta-glucanase (GH16 family)